MMNDFEVELVEDYAEVCDCGHFHGEFIECPERPERDEPCGDYRCCIN